MSLDVNKRIRLVQLIHSVHGRAVAIVEEPSLILLKDYRSVYDLALEAIDRGEKLASIIPKVLSTVELNYDSIYEGKSLWKLLPSFDHPNSKMACLVSGTGLTHMNSALNRQTMHIKENEKSTDSMIMYQWGVDNGFPDKGSIGVQPEWFYKGNGSILKAHGETLEVPVFGEDGGEEPEVAGVYIVDRNGKPWRIGFTTGNEFSDHVMEKRNYLYLAPSKLRSCAIGPEIVIDEEFVDLKGTVSVLDGDRLVWSSPIKTGQKHMAHSLENLEYHHFKYTTHRLPGQAHVHFFGADAFSYGIGLRLKNRYEMQVCWEGMGRVLRNYLRVSDETEVLLPISPL